MCEENSKQVVILDRESIGALAGEIVRRGYILIERLAKEGPEGGAIATLLSDALKKIEAEAAKEERRRWREDTMNRASRLAPDVPNLIEPLHAVVVDAVADFETKVDALRKRAGGDLQ